MIRHFDRLCQVFSELFFFREGRSVTRNPLFYLHLLSLIAIRDYKSRIKHCLDLQSNPVQSDNFIRLSSNYYPNLYYGKNYPLNLNTFIWKYAVCTYMQVIPLGMNYL